MRYRFEHRGQVYDVVIERRGADYSTVIDGQEFAFEQLDAQPGQISLRFAGQPVTLYHAADGAQKWVSLDGCTYNLTKPSPRRSSHGEQAAGEQVRSPMPAQVRAVQISAGDAVEKGQVLVLLEAMKMEIRIKAPSEGRVINLTVKAGQTVDKDQLLVEIG